MNTINKFKRLPLAAFILMVFLAIIQAGFAQEAPAQTMEPDAEAEVEILTRGPVHEAFAEPLADNPEQGVVVPQEPPQPIEEVAPEEIPEGDNVQWIPGYWFWDEELEDFIWISGVWRDPPPDHSWVPGYWTPVEGGWVWTPGFWAAAAIEEVEYLPEPPQSVEVGPSSPAPSDDHLWAPGAWTWTETRYVWRPGYWVAADPNWIWSPAHYVWTPRGYVYVDGYWDRPFETRGVVFAPVYVRPAVYMRPHYVYRPSIVIRVDFLASAIFVTSHSRHYYFGDYYGDVYYRRGFRPWFEINRRSRGHDHIYAHHRWRHGRWDRSWEQNLHNDYMHRRRNPDARPPRTYAAHVGASGRTPGNRNFAAPISTVAKQHDTPLAFRKLSSIQQHTLSDQVKKVSSFRDARVKWESVKPRNITTPEPAKPRTPSIQPRTDTPRSIQPKTIEPKTSQPRTIQSRTSQPGTIQPKTIQPGTTAPRTIQPKAIEPKTSQPRTIQSRTSQPGTIQPGTTAPRTIQPRTIEPKTTQPEVIQPRTFQPRSFEPKNDQPRTTIQPRTIQPRSFEPKEDRPGTSIQPRQFQPGSGPSAPQIQPGTPSGGSTIHSPIRVQIPRPPALDRPTNSTIKTMNPPARPDMPRTTPGIQPGIKGIQSIAPPASRSIGPSGSSIRDNQGPSRIERPDSRNTRGSSISIRGGRSENEK